MLLGLRGWQLEYQLIVNLQNHFDGQIFRFDFSLDIDHSDLNQIGCRPLYDRIYGQPPRLRTLAGVATFEIQNPSPTVQNRLDIAVLRRLLDNTVVLYGPDLTPGELVSKASEYPMFTPTQLIQASSTEYM